jgi:ABC-type branched-subunit amino acid transport system substrate-binding protein
VYVSAPLSGAEAEDGEAITAGARRALEEAGGEAGGVEVVLEELDVAAGDAPWDPVTAGANARRATQDSASIAYLGELESGATRASLPITNEADLLQIAPGSPAPDLVSPFEGSDEVPEATQPSGVRTFGRLANPPADPETQGYLAAAAALDAIERSDDPLSRGAVVEAFFEPGEHDSVAGSYSVDELGEIDHRGPP